MSGDGNSPTTLLMKPKNDGMVTVKQLRRIDVDKYDPKSVLQGMNEAYGKGCHA